jgi:uncharacterized repeat protein (TIGR02543 family)
MIPALTRAKTGCQLNKGVFDMRYVHFLKTEGTVLCFLLALVLVSCNNNSPTQPASPKYTVTYNGNGNTGGTTPIDANTYAQGATVTVKANTGTLVRTGYSFAGWNTLADGTGNSYAASGSATFIMGSAGIALFAQWTKAAIDFHITNPATGTAFNMGSPVTIRWTLPADGSIDTVVVYRKLSGQDYEALNQYMPVIAPEDSFPWFIGSDAPGQDFKVRIQNAHDSTEFDEITIHENGY